MKKLFALLLCMVMMIPVLAMADTEITLWTYPIGNWANTETVDGIVAEINKVHPEIKVNVQYLKPSNGYYSPRP